MDKTKKKELIKKIKNLSKKTKEFKKISSKDLVNGKILAIEIKDEINNLSIDYKDFEKEKMFLKLNKLKDIMILYISNVESIHNFENKWKMENKVKVGKIQK